MAVGPAVTVELVESSGQLRRFAEIPWLLHHDEPRWRAPVRTFDRRRLSTSRHPRFEHGDGALFLARRGGRLVGRIAAHHGRGDNRHDGRFGFFDVSDDGDVAAALIGAARGWLETAGCPTMWGPVSWFEHEELGVRILGHDLPAMTARPWHPAWYATRLVEAGGTPGAQRPTFLVTPTRSSPAPARSSRRLPQPPHAGRYGDPRLVLDGIAAVPDVAAVLASATLRSAWHQARLVRTGHFDRAVCVTWTGDPAAQVPELLAVAGAAGYREVATPWAETGTAPVIVDQVFSFGQ